MDGWRSQLWGFGPGQIKELQRSEEENGGCPVYMFRTFLNSIAGLFPQTRDAKRQNSGNVENNRFPPQRLPGSPEDSESLWRSCT